MKNYTGMTIKTINLEIQEDETFVTYGRYVVSDHGHIFNTYGRRLKPNDIGDGYHQVTLYGQGDRKSMLVHRIVAKLFVDNPHGYSEVNHKDGNPSNNHWSNLEWVTASQNVKHAYDLKGKRERPNRGRLDRCQVLTIRSIGRDLPVTQLARYFKVNRSTVRQVLDNKTWR